jgi:hypothetical protein
MTQDLPTSLSVSTVNIGFPFETSGLLLTPSVVSCPLFPSTTSSAAVGDSCHVHSSSPLVTADHV